MKRIFIAALMVSCSPCFVTAQTTKKTTAPTTAKKVVMKNLMDSFSYAAGLNIAANMKEQGVTKINNAILVQAMDDFFNNKPTALTNEVAMSKLQEQLQLFVKQKADAQKQKDKVFFTQNAARKEVTSLPNGMQYEILKAGDPAGVKPVAEDEVVVHYVGTLVDGTEFDNSVKRGQPATFKLNQVIRGWTEILQLMTKGAKWKVVIPSELGYGERGNGPLIPGNAALVFEIELIDIKPLKKD